MLGSIPIPLQLSSQQYNLYLYDAKKFIDINCFHLLYNEMLKRQTGSWVIQGVELLGHWFGSQLFPVLFKWLISSVFQITACKTTLTLFVLCIKAEIGTTHPADYTYCPTQQVSILFGASNMTGYQYSERQ